MLYYLDESESRRNGSRRNGTKVGVDEMGVDEMGGNPFPHFTPLLVTIKT